MKNELISVIVPIYNGEAYFHRCFDSILTQTYQNIEIIAVDDGSTDGSAALLDNLAKTDARIKPVHQENAGAAAARMTGINNAVGDYLTFVDCDDFIDATMLETLHRLITSGDYQIACADIKTVYSEEEAIVSGNNATEEYTFEDAMKNLYQHALWSSCAKLYDRALFRQEPVVKKLIVSEDLLLVYSLYKQCKKMILTHQMLYYYYRHSDSVMAEGFSAKHIRDSMTAYRMIAEDMDKGSRAYIYHIQNLLANDFSFLNGIVLEGAAKECYPEIRREILRYKKYAFIKNGSSAINRHHKMGIPVLAVCPPLLNLLIKIKG